MRAINSTITNRESIIELLPLSVVVEVDGYVAAVSLSPSR